MSKSNFSFVFGCTLWSFFVLELLGCQDSLPQKKTITPTEKSLPENATLIRFDGEQRPLSDPIQKLENPPSFPPLFYISADFSGKMEGEKNFRLQTRIRGNLRTLVYEVKTPLVFLDEVETVDNPKISRGILFALDQSFPLRGTKRVFSPEVPVGEYRFIRQENHRIMGEEDKWREHTLKLSIPRQPGLYLLEAHLGPQAAFVPFYVSPAQYVLQEGKEENLLWLTRNKSGLGDIPVFYRSRDGRWENILGSSQGIASLPKEGSPWLVPWKPPFIEVVPLSPQSHSLEPKVWLDRFVYRKGESLELAWINGYSSVARTLVLTKSSGKLIEKRSFAPSSSRVKKLSWNILLEPDEYILFFFDQPQNRVTFWVKPEKTLETSFLPSISMSKEVFSPQEDISLLVYSHPEKTCSLHLFYYDPEEKKEILLDEQVRLCQEGEVKFFFRLSELGQYRVKVGVAEAKFSIQTPYSKKFQSQVVQKNFQRKEEIPFWLCSSDVDRLIVFEEDGHIVKSTWHAPSKKPQLMTFRSEGKGKQASLSQFSLENGGEELSWSWRFNSHSEVTLEAPVKVKSKEEFYLDLEWRTHFTKEKERFLLVRALAGNHLWSVEAQRSKPSPVQVRAEAQLLKGLYHQWAQKIVLRKYAQAMTTWENGQYWRAAQQCQEILDISPSHQPSRRLLEKAFQKEKEAWKKNTEVGAFLLERLQKTKIAKPPEIGFVEFIDYLATQTSVYIELDPSLVPELSQTKVSLEKMPAFSDSFSILSYVLLKLRLVYKIKEGTFFITQSSDSSSSNNIEASWKNLDQDLFSLSSKSLSSPNLYSVVSWKDWQSSAQKEKISFRLPNPGVWTIIVLAVDEKNQVYETRKLIWAY